MNNKDQALQVEEPIVAEDGPTPAPAVTPAPETRREDPSLHELISRTIKDAIKDNKRSLGRDEPGWTSVPGIVAITTGRASADQASRPETSPSAPRAAEGAGIDPGVTRRELGDLLNAVPSRPNETDLSANEIHQVERAPLNPARSPVTDHAFPDSPISPKQVSAVSSVQGNSTQIPNPSTNDLSGSSPARSGAVDIGYQGPAGLRTLAASEPAGLSDKVPSNVTEPDAFSPGVGRSEATVGWPADHRVADQLAFAPWSPGADAGTSEASPYSVDVQESAVSSSALGPILSGLAGAGPGEDTGLSGGGGTGETGGPATSGSWPGVSASEGASQESDPALDLSKTNELLQQLLDEFRRGRQTFLPINDRNQSSL